MQWNPACQGALSPRRSTFGLFRIRHIRGGGSLEKAHDDFGRDRADGRFDGVDRQRPDATTWRRPACPGPERDANRYAGGVPRFWAALRAGIHLDLRPLRPLLVPSLRLSAKSSANIHPGPFRRGGPVLHGHRGPIPSRRMKYDGACGVYSLRANPGDPP
jgi:hypothetical protein